MTRLVALTDDDIKLISECLDKCPEYYLSTSKIKNKLTKAQNRITIASAKNKGRGFQYWICQKISELLDIPYNQQDDDCMIHSREMSQQGVDIILRGKARELFPFDIESKAMSTMDIPPAVYQADKNASPERIGMVVYKQTNVDPVVIFSWGSFVKMFNKYIFRREDG